MVGDTVWIRNENNRVYKTDPKGKQFGAPIRREFWQPHTIVAETSRSWVLKNGRKIPKKHNSDSNVAFTEEEIEHWEWIQDNRHKIVARLWLIKDYSMLHEIATIIGYGEE